MKISINNKIVEFAEAVNIEDVLRKAKIVEERGIALAVNNAVVPRADWSKFPLHDNDKVIVIKATQGG